MGFEFWVSNFGFQASSFEFQVQGFGFRISSFGFRLLGLRHLLPERSSAGRRQRPDPPLARRRAGYPAGRRLFIHLSTIYLSTIHLSIYLSIYDYIYLSIYSDLSIYLYLSIYVSMAPSKHCSRKVTAGVPSWARAGASKSLYWARPI